MKKKENIKIALVRTWSPGNIGSVARAAKNFGFKNLVAVNQINFNIDESRTMAAGAKDHMEYFRNSNSLYEEVKSSNVVYAFSNRKRKHYKVLSPEQMAKEIASLPEESKVTILFGNETNGLNNDELDLADKLVTIPTDPNYPSLNLSMATMLSLYEIHKHIETVSTTKDDSYIDSEEKRIAKDQIAEIIAEKVLEKDIHKKQVLDNINMLFKRMMLNKKEINFIRTIFKIIEKKLK
ncbi:MAG: hypothetical protein CR982_04760 [Candidatus Cloacimonadota bacterium]|nr:MAG: hypothetical protein CR982_04760 [Candidatus Cloacimonadota bacterium]PIE81759.1 MAG: hypothetical protein CSA15_00385 [Candidatus Delongbacteria bacterium]